ncbi:MAG: helix-turn-helix domain-containing protein [Prevotellaceae bacterium]|nr:helix-turn-helix domain-containing protein [Prevotellaceae bacterium]
MNPLLTTKEEAFRTGMDNLTCFLHHAVKLPGGALLFCTKGEADVFIDMQPAHIVPQTNISLLPGMIFSLERASADFECHYFAFSEEMFAAASFRLDASYIHFLGTHPWHTHRGGKEELGAIYGLIEASNAICGDMENRCRRAIALHLLQIFFLNTYDKVRRIPAHELTLGSSRKEELFKQFITLVHAHGSTERDVGFYATRLCITPRYLSTIAREVGHTSPKAFIDECLTLELKVALQSTDLSLKEIADRYRFPDQSFFGRFFKKHTGLSPKAYRMAQKGEI